MLFTLLQVTGKKELVRFIDQKENSIFQLLFPAVWT
jgi:hypothetical protein